MDSSLRWYLGSTAAFLVSAGVQVVLYPWLVAVYLHESPARVGLAQMAAQLPMLLLILLGGYLGDRVDQRRLLVGLHLGMALPPLLMALLFGLDRVNYLVLIAWAMIGGTFAAFAQPARDALLNRVAGQDIQRVVTLAVGVQFGVQILGFGLGSTAGQVGPIPLLLCIALFMAAAAFATSRVPALPAAAVRSRRPMVLEIRDGLRLVWQSESIRPVVIQTFAVGMFFAGSYMVLLPLMVRDLYDGGAGGIALAYAANMLGTCTTVFVLMRLGGVERPGRAMIVGTVVSAVILSLLFFDLPDWGFYGSIYLWGLCGGINMTMSRSIVQEASPESHRARVLSVYSLGMMGGLPLGSLLLGFCAEILGVRQAVLVPVVGMLLVVLTVRFTSRLWYVKRLHELPMGS